MRALTLASLLLLPLLASADVPRRMTWHGRLARADGSPETSPQILKFALYPAASGGAALWEETLQNVPVVNGAYAVVLLDLTMPLLDGEETFRQLRLLQPDVRIILMSGFNKVEAINRFLGKGLAGFIQKPFEVDTLASELQRVAEGLSGLG